MSQKSKTIIYWTTTAIMGFVMLSGGVGDILRPAALAAGMALLGYPAYFSIILGVWKVLGGITILVPKYPRLKEWAYAGIMFDVTGATASHAFSADYGAAYFHIWVPLLMGVFTLLSWYYRPESRVMGEICKSKAA